MQQAGHLPAAAEAAPPAAAPQHAGQPGGHAGTDPEGGPADAAYGAEGGTYGYADAEGGAAVAPAAAAADQQCAAEGGADAQAAEAAVEAGGGDGEGAAGAAADQAAAAGEGEAAYSAAEYLGQLEAHLAGLQQQRQGLQQQLAAAAAGAYQQMSTALGATSTGVPLPADLPALAGELVVLQGVRQYLAYVQVGSCALCSECRLFGAACALVAEQLHPAGPSHVRLVEYNACACVLALLLGAHNAPLWRHSSLQELQALVRHLDKTIRALQQQAAAGAAAGSAEAAALLQALGEAVDGFSNAVGYAIAVQQLTGGHHSTDPSHRIWICAGLGSCCRAAALPAS